MQVWDWECYVSKQMSIVVACRRAGRPLVLFFGLLITVCREGNTVAGQAFTLGKKMDEGLVRLAPVLLMCGGLAVGTVQLPLAGP